MASLHAFGLCLSQLPSIGATWAASSPRTLLTLLLREVQSSTKNVLLKRVLIGRLGRQGAGDIIANTAVGQRDTIVVQVQSNGRRDDVLGLRTGSAESQCKAAVRKAGGVEPTESREKCLADNGCVRKAADRQSGGAAFRNSPQ